MADLGVRIDKLLHGILPDGDIPIFWRNKWKSIIVCEKVERNLSTIEFECMLKRADRYKWKGLTTSVVWNKLYE